MNEQEVSGMLTALGKVSPAEVLASDTKVPSKFLSVGTMELVGFPGSDQHERSCSLSLVLGGSAEWMWLLHGSRSLHQSC